jgi:hypothetical protein
MTQDLTADLGVTSSGLLKINITVFTRRRCELATIDRGGLAELQQLA